MLPLSAGDGAELGTVWAETGGLYAGEDRRGGRRLRRVGVAVPLSAGAVGSSNPVGVGEEGEGGGLGTLGTIAAAWPPPPPASMPRVPGLTNMLSHVAGGEGNGGARGSLFGSWDPEGKREGGALT